MDLPTLLIAFLAAVIANAIELPIIYLFINKQGTNKLLDRLANPDEKVEKAVHGLSEILVSDLWKSLNTPSIPFEGPKTKDGLPTTDMLTPIHAVIRDGINSAKGEISTAVMQKVWGAEGAITKEAQSTMAALGGMPRKRRKGEPLGEYLAEIASQRLMPQIQKTVEDKLTQSVKEKINEYS